MKRVARTACVAAAFPAALVIVLAVVFRIASFHREARDAVQAAPSEGRLIPAGDVKLFVQELGPSNGPVALFTHGMGAWSGLWRPVLEPVAAAGVRCVIVDLPPFGFSERPKNGDYSRAAQARRLWAALDSLGAARASLVGHSFGSGSVAEAALSSPERVVKLILFAPALGLDAPKTPPSGALAAILNNRLAAEALVSATLANPLMTRRGLTGFMAKTEAATPERLAVLRRPLASRGYVAGLARWLPGFLFSTEDSPSYRGASYASLKMPVLLVYGDLDTTTPLAQGRRLKTLIPGADLVVLPGIGHMPQLEATAEAQELLISRLAPAARR